MHTTPNRTPYRTVGDLWQLYCEPPWEPPCTARPQAQERAEAQAQELASEREAIDALTPADGAPVDVALRSRW